MLRKEDFEDKNTLNRDFNKKQYGYTDPGILAFQPEMNIKTVSEKLI